MKTVHSIPLQPLPQLGLPEKAKTKKPVKGREALTKPIPTLSHKAADPVVKVAEPTASPCAATNPADIAWQRMVDALDAGLVKLFSEDERLQFACLKEGAGHADASPKREQATKQAAPSCAHQPSEQIGLLEEQKIALAVATKAWGGAIIQHVVINADEDDSTILKPKLKPRGRQKRVRATLL